MNKIEKLVKQCIVQGKQLRSYVSGLTLQRPLSPTTTYIVTRDGIFAPTTDEDDGQVYIGDTGDILSKVKSSYSILVSIDVPTTDTILDETSVAVYNKYLHIFDYMRNNNTSFITKIAMKQQDWGITKENVHIIMEELINAKLIERHYSAFRLTLLTKKYMGTLTGKEQRAILSTPALMPLLPANTKPKTHRNSREIFLEQAKEVNSIPNEEEK